MNKINNLPEPLSVPRQNPDSCAGCDKAAGLCVCDAISKIDNRLKILVLQHPQEKKEQLATVPLLEASLKNCIVKVGLSWPNLKRAAGEDADVKQWAVLYLGTLPKDEKLAAVTDELQLSADIKPASLKGIVVIDGSWREAKALWWRNAWFLKLHRLVIHPKEPALYNALRREPKKESLSTLESVAVALSAIENDSYKAKLLAPLQLLIEKSKKTGQRPMKRDWRRKNRGGKFKR